MTKGALSCPPKGGMMVEKTDVLSTKVFKDSWEYKQKAQQSFIAQDVTPDKKKAKKTAAELKRNQRCFTSSKKNSQILVDSCSSNRVRKTPCQHNCSKVINLRDLKTSPMRLTTT